MITATKTERIVISLGIKEATWLRDTMQNPIGDMEKELPEHTKMRSMFWESLNEILESPHK